MSDSQSAAAVLEAKAEVFGALGDKTRLALVLRLARGESRSISQLAAGSDLTRQAISKHLRVLEQARIVRNFHIGRESLFALEPRSLADLGDFLESVSAQWDAALTRLSAFVEDAPHAATPENSPSIPAGGGGRTGSPAPAPRRHKRSPRRPR